MGTSLLFDQNLSRRTGQILTFLVTTCSMALVFTLIPLLPSPLPLIVAFLVGYAVYRDPPVGSLAGSAIIALGLFYHLSRIGFFQLFPGPWVRLLVMVIILIPFVLISTQLAENIAVISMNVGIIAVSLLFFKSTYYLAVPVILIWATIYKNRGIIVTFSYYTIISLPLQVMQYMKTFSNGAKPPLYTPLDIIYNDIQQSMSEVSMTEINKIIGVIGKQFLLETGNGGVMEPALTSFINSLPGMIFFLIISSVIISVAALITLMLPEFLKNAQLPRRYANVIIYAIPITAAILTNIIFFIMLEALQGPLAFQASVDTSIIMLSTSFTIFLSVPVAFSKYIVDLRDIIASRKEELIEGTETVLQDIQRYRGLIEALGDPIPVSFLQLHTKILVVEDEVKEMITAATESNTSLGEVDAMIRRTLNSLSGEATNFRWQLDVALDDHFIKITFEYLESVHEIQELGLDIEAPVIEDIPPESTLESKTEYINYVVDSGGVLVDGLISTADKIYEIIKSLFEPSLPRDSPIIQISKEKKERDEPWVIIDAILTSLKNWEKQYSTEIISSTRPIKDSVEAVIELSKREDELLPILGDRFNLIRDLVEGLEVSDLGGEEDLKVLKVILIRDTIFATVEVVARVIGILYDHIKELEMDIDSLLPMEDYEWNKNLTLVDRMNTSLVIIRNYRSHEINEIMSHLYRTLSYIDEAVETIQYYNARKELLLNYCILEKKITRILDERDEVSLDDLGVSEKYGREYLKLYIRGHYSDSPLEEVADTLRRVR